MKTTLKEATLTLNSRFDGVWVLGESVLPKRAWDCCAFIWDDKELLLRRSNTWWIRFLADWWGRWRPQAAWCRGDGSGDGGDGD